MALRINNFVTGGEINNLVQGLITGTLELDDRTIRFQLTGNLCGQLEGLLLRFRVDPNRKPGPDDAMPGDRPELAELQTGAVGGVVLRQVRVPTIPIAEFNRRCKRGEPSPCDITNGLYLEWFSDQNGRVVAEVDDPLVELITADGETAATPVFAPVPGYNSDGSQKEDGDASISQTSTPDGLRSWDEVIPGIDPKTQALYEQWDEIYHGDNEQPVSEMFDPPLKLPPSDRIVTDEQAEPLVCLIEDRLAELNVVLDHCDHATPLFVYHTLVKEILPTAAIHPNLPATGIVQHYCMWEYCEKCLAEFDPGQSD